MDGEQALAQLAHAASLISGGYAARPRAGTAAIREVEHLRQDSARVLERVRRREQGEIASSSPQPPRSGQRGNRRLPPAVLVRAEDRRAESRPTRELSLTEPERAPDLAISSAATRSVV